MRLAVRGGGGGGTQSSVLRFAFSRITFLSKAINTETNSKTDFVMGIKKNLLTAVVVTYRHNEFVCELLNAAYSLPRE